MEYKEIEDRWQREWDEARLFESNVDSRPSYFVTAAFPYANAPQHIGHLRTFGTADVLARYKRMRGFNVLFPMGFHATGTPVLAFAKRIKSRDEDLVKELKLFSIPDEEIAKMTDPTYIANYFVKEIERGMHLAGFSIDWRRKFVSIDPFFSKMIEWQFGKLNDKGFLIRGKHAVGWCPNENNAVGMHDTKHDVEPEIEKEVAIRFRIKGEDSYLLCVTLRPETIHGVTNLFVNENAKYALCSMEGAEGKYYIAKESIPSLKYQFSIVASGEASGSELIGKSCTNPITGAELPVLPGFFVNEGIGTGVVMSVPAHAPFDYAAVERLKAEGKADNIEPIIVLETGELEEGEIPALAYMRKAGAEPGSDEKLLEIATKLQYKAESHKGRMIADGLKGLTEPEAREKIKGMLLGSGDALEVYALANEGNVMCRCGTGVVVKVVDNQWFLNYGDAKWKETAKDALGNMNILPEKSRNAFESALGWINLRAVVRAQGLGTKFPFEKQYIIESLSDSTVYMAFYTISYIIREVDPERLTPAFFSFVFLGDGNAGDVAKETGIDFDKVRKSRESFEYWYNETSRHSGPDLIFNHLTMYIFNHAAIFERKRWPKQIVVNGSVLCEGEKMSKSLGNIIPLADAFAKYGVDPLRFVVIAGAELFSDSEFNDEAVNGVRERFEYLHNASRNADGLGMGELNRMDYWLYSKLNRKIDGITASMEKLELRDASTQLLYNTVLELKRYFAKGGNNSMVVKDYLSKVILMMQPIAPHVSEELWHMLGNNSFASAESWPSADKEMISEVIEEGEELVERAVLDAKQVMELMGRKGGGSAREIRIITAGAWKHDALGIISETKDIGKTVAGIRDKYPSISSDIVSKYAAVLMRKTNELRKGALGYEEEYEAFLDSSEYIAKILGVKVRIEKEEDSDSQRASRASPMKPSIDVLS